MNNPNPTPRLDPRKVLWFIGVSSMAAIALLAWVSLAQPLSTTYLDWNYLASSTLNLLASIGAATAGILVTRQFGRDENPYHIWLNFTIGLWCWALGQGIVFFYDITALSYPEGISITDILWILGYVFLGLSLYHQLMLVYSAGKWKRSFLYLTLVSVALLAAALLTNQAVRAGLGEGSPWIVVFVAVIYPVFDLAEGTGAIWLSLLFGRGSWSRPWWGMILFALADGIDTFYWVGGYDLIPLTAQNVLNFLSSIFSFGGYLVIGFALLINYFVLRYGHASGLLKTPQVPAPPPPPAQQT